MTETIGSDGELDGHERVIAPVIIFELFVVEGIIGFQGVEDLCDDDFRQEVVDYDLLIMPPHDLLRGCKIHALFIDHLVVEPVHQAL